MDCDVIIMVSSVRIVPSKWGGGLVRRQGPVNWARRCSAMVGTRDCGGDYVANNKGNDG